MSSDPEGWGYGYGWMIVPGTQPRLIKHYGGINGFSSVIERYPDANATVVVFENQETGTLDVITDSIAKKLFGK